MSTTTLLPNRERGLARNMVEGTVIGLVLTALSFLVGMEAGWIVSINWLEAFAVFTSYLCTFLCVMERRINYPVGVVTTAAYCILFYQWGLFASMAINAYLVIALAYGWFRWKSDTDTRPVTHLQVKWIPAYVAATAVGYLGVVAIASALGGTLAAADSVILVGTLLAQFMLDNKKLENWAVWAVVNVFAIYTYFTAGLFLAAFQYVFFLLNTGYGFYTWRKTMPKATKVNEHVSLPVLKEATV